jgi:hypothetical protein
MQQIGNHLSNFTQQNPHGPASLTDLPPNTVPKQPQRTQRMGTADKARLSETLGRVCALQREYGKSSAELETLVEGFAWAMAAYPVEDIIRAMGTWVLSHREIPTPSDLLDILRPPRRLRSNPTGPSTSHSVKESPTDISPTATSAISCIVASATQSTAA